jgi:predicted nucleic acid-binding protein
MILADTSAFLAILDRQDDDNARVGAAWTDLVEREQIVTHSYVVGETVALVQARLGLLAVERFRDVIEPLLEIVWVDQELHDLAMTATLTAARRKVSLIDHTSFVVMRRLGMMRALALDRHFAEQGFELVPGA